MLRLEGIRKAYGKNLVLDGVSLECNSGEAICLIGANAAGKTTLLTIAGGLQLPDSGTRLCEGRVGYVPQEPALLEALTLKENLSLWYAAYGLPKNKMFSDTSMETLLELGPFAKTPAGKLSGGVKKRLSVVCALLGDPQWILLDEPFAALDIASRESILKLLKELKSKGKGMLLISHDPLEAGELADRALLLKAGRIHRDCLLSGNLEERSSMILKLLSQA